MRRFCAMLTGAAWILAGAIAGCGGDTAPAPGSGFLDSPTSVEFKSTDLTPFESMKNAMMKNMQTKAYTKKPAATKEKGETKK